MKKVGDGECYGGSLNRIKCEFEGGDCINFNLAYPDCSVEKAFKVGNNECDEEYNTPDCKFDGGDCCPYEILEHPFLGAVNAMAGLFTQRGVHMIMVTVISLTKLIQIVPLMTYRLRLISMMKAFLFQLLETVFAVVCIP